MGASILVRALPQAGRALGYGFKELIKRIAPIADDIIRHLGDEEEIKIPKKPTILTKEFDKTPITGPIKTRKHERWI